jgi:peptide deformylase
VIVNPLPPLEPYEEGCLSLPGIRGDVIRPTTVTIKAIGLDGKPFEQTATGLLARCWQHEYDHLDGVLIIDRMTQMSRIKNRAAVRSLERGE